MRPYFVLKYHRYCPTVRLYGTWRKYSRILYVASAMLRPDRGRGRNLQQLPSVRPTVPAAHYRIAFCATPMSSGDSTRTLGATGPSVPPLGLGGAWVQPIPDVQAMGAVDAAWDAGTRYFDTAPW
jgi:hypothetical protein